MLVLGNTDKNNISKLISILRKHPNKAMSPEFVADDILILIKYTDDINLQNIIHGLKGSIHDTTISVPFYYTSYFPTHVYENIITTIKFFFLLYAVTILSYVGASVKTAVDSHVEIQYTTIFVNALITGLFPAATAILVKEREKISQQKGND
jgi:hypothetical protein